MPGAVRNVDDPRALERGPAGPAVVSGRLARAVETCFLPRPGGTLTLVHAGEPVPAERAGSPLPAEWDDADGCWKPARKAAGKATAKRT